MPLPLLWVLGAIAGGFFGSAAAAAALTDDDGPSGDAEAEARAKAERRRKQREREEARARFVAMRNEEIRAFARAHGLSVDAKRLSNASARSSVPKALVFQAIESKYACMASHESSEERELRVIETARATIARLLAPES